MVLEDFKHRIYYRNGLSVEEAIGPFLKRKIRGLQVINSFKIPLDIEDALRKVEEGWNVEYRGRKLGDEGPLIPDLVIRFPHPEMKVLDFVRIFNDEETKLPNLSGFPSTDRVEYIDLIIRPSEWELIPLYKGVVCHLVSIHVKIKG